MQREGEAVREGEVPGLGLEKQPPMVNGPGSGLAGESTDGRLSSSPRSRMCPAGLDPLWPSEILELPCQLDSFRTCREMGQDTDAGLGRVRGILGGSWKSLTWGGQNSFVGYS